MKDNISYAEIKYIKRRLAPKIREIIGKFPAVVVTGARQVGKSTMLQNEFREFAYLTMDDYDIVERARLDPRSLWREKDHIIIDEAQKVPGLFNAVKLTIDSSPKKKRFILSGSSNLLLMEKNTESLAGRAIYFDLLPMTYGETMGNITPENFLHLWDGKYIEKEQTVKETSPLPLMMRGFMPSLLGMKDHGDVLLWLEGYVKTYLERDLREVSQIESLVDFRKVMQTLALRTGNILNQADVAKDSGISHPTTHRYIKLLEISNIIQRVPGFFRSHGKRIVKSPKVYFVDPALSIFLSGYLDEESLIRSREVGGYFETMVFLHVRELCEMMKPRATIHYWRTTTGKEVDLVLEHGKKLLALEVKITRDPTVHDIKNLLLFIDEYPETIRGVLVHTGKAIKWLHSKVIAVPWWWLDM
ncbi:TPA: ATP-binding protein [Candidatus Bathyarchaeota archaeon]|nr:ATP-binding protein [Candidatus Bathyarchaeota archaeon]